MSEETVNNTNTETYAKYDSNGNIISTTYAKLISPNLIGAPTAPTLSNDNDSIQLATTEFVHNVVNSLVTSAPENIEALNTLSNTLASKSDLVSSIVIQLNSKVDKDDVVSAPTANKILKLDSNAKLPASITGNAATATAVDWTGITNKPASYTPSNHTQDVSTIEGLAGIAKTGKYIDIIDPPIIPTHTSQLTNDSRFLTSDEIAPKALADANGNVIDKIYATKEDMSNISVTNINNMNFKTCLLVIPVTEWDSEKSYTYTNPNITAKSLIILAPQQNTTNAMYDMIADAILSGIEQKDGSIKIKSLGLTPNIDISLLVLIGPDCEA